MSLRRVAGRHAREFVHRIRRDRRAYLAALGPRPAKIRKFCIVTNGRTGSSPLVDLLNSHPAIRCDEELLKEWRDLPFLYVRGHAAQAKREGCAAYGFKLNTGAVRLAPVETGNFGKLIDLLASDGFSFIWLQRRNLVRQVVSGLRGREHGFQIRGDEHSETRIVADPVQLVASLRTFAYQADVIGQRLEPYPHLDLWYEDDLEDPAVHQRTVDKICDYLGLPGAPVSTEFRKVAPARLHDAIANYDEIAQVLAPTPFAAFLDD
jgi:hypothetical protein